MKNILAKSNGITLINHSTLVSRFAVEMAKQSLLEHDKNLIEGIRIGALLHDIGKCQKSFQNKLKKVNVDDYNVDPKSKFRHNEVGWAFLMENLKLNGRVKKIVLDVVYWHHGISNKMASYKNSDVTISKLDVKTMTNYLISVLGNDYVLDSNVGITKSPTFYTTTINDFLDIDEAKELNSIKTFARTCVISADRLVSGLEDKDYTDEEITKIVEESSLRENKLDILTHKYNTPDNTRFNLQKSILNDIDRTTIVKAPAGFGKTLLGLMWSFRKNKKLIWVCPRNIVASSVYKSIIEELTNFGDNQLSVELFLGNEVVNSNKHFKEPFSSDIIVTNIDNYLSPSVNNRNANNLHSIINFDVVFDEFHEIVGDKALNSAFINLMCLRHQLSNSETLLLSATPSNLHKLWDGLDNKTTILPNENEHYPAPHNKKYKINILNEFPSNVDESSNLFVFNSIKNAQINKRKLNSEILYHSSFIDSHKKEIVDKIYETYGKKSERNVDKVNLVGTHVIQASLDISFSKLYESVLSPESTLQRIGRCDRWGDYDLTPEINIINFLDKSETSVKNILYSNNLSNVWFDYISKYDGQELTLNELYEIYNSFTKEHSKVLFKFISDKYAKSLDRLSHIYPIKFNINGKSDVITSGGNKLRSNNSEIFVICKRYGSELYSDPFNVSMFNDFTTEFNEGLDVRYKMIRTMKHLRDINDERFDYNSIINNHNNITLDEIRKRARKSNTPYIRYDKWYHDEFGVIKKGDLDLILKFY